MKQAFLLPTLYIWRCLGSRKFWFIECYTADKGQHTRHKTSDTDVVELDP